MRVSGSDLAACCADASAVNRFCVEIQREMETSCQPLARSVRSHVLDDAPTEKTRAQISQSEAECERYRGGLKASGGYHDAVSHQVFCSA